MANYYEILENIAACIIGKVPYIRHAEPFMQQWHKGLVGYNVGGGYIDSRFDITKVPYFWIEETAAAAKVRKGNVKLTNCGNSYTISKELRMVAMVTKGVNIYNLENCLIGALSRCACCGVDIVITASNTNNYDILNKGLAGVADAEFIDKAAKNFEYINLISIDFTLTYNIPMISENCICEVCEDCD